MKNSKPVEIDDGGSFASDKQKRLTDAEIKNNRILMVPLPANLKDPIVVPYQGLKAFVQQETAAYYECTADAFARLDNDLIEVADREKENVTKRQTFNKQLLEEVQATTDACALAATNAHQGLYHWSNTEDQHLPFLNTSNSNCSSDDHESVSRWLGQDLQDFEDEVLVHLRDYRDTSENSFKRMGDYAKERTAYDYNYFLHGHIEPALELLGKLTNTTVYTVQFSVNPQDVLNDILLAFELFKEALEKAYNRIDILTDFCEKFYGSIEDFYIHYTNLLERARDIIDFTRPKLPPQVWMGTTGLFDLSEFPDPPSLLPEKFYVPQFDDFPNVELMANDFADNVAHMIGELLEQLAREALDVLLDSSMETWNQIQELLRMEDYNPPQFKGSRPNIASIDAEAAYLSQAGDATEASAKKALENVHAFRNTSSSEIPSELPNVDPVDHPFSGNATTFGYEPLSVPRFEWLERLANVFKFLTKFGVLIDAFSSLFRIWRLKRKYELNALPQLPGVRLGAAENETEDGNGWEGKFFSCCKVFFMVLNLLGYAIFAIGLLGFFAWCGSAVVYPWVQDVCGGSHSGSMLGNNALAPAVINQASNPGNTLHTEREHRCRQQQQMLCDSMLVKTEISYRNDVTALSNFQHSHNQSIVFTSSLERCIDMEVLDSNFRDACCGLEGYHTECPLEPQLRAHRCPIDDLARPPAAFYPTGRYLSEPACQADASEWKLKDSRFDCQALQEKCSDTPCTGVDEDLIRSMVTEAECQTYQSGFRYLAFFFMIFCHCAAISSFGKFIFNGLKGVYWEKLNPSGIHFEAYMDRDSQFHGDAAPEERKKITEVKIKKFEYLGRVQLILGTLLFLVWFTALFTFRDLV